MVYVTDATPGISREKRGTGFCYRTPDGEVIRDEETLERIRKLAIPPAWTNVWICPDPRGHIQATGRDARGRKQYRYHPEWRRVRDESKYAKLAEFGAALPDIRQRVDRDLSLKGMARNKVLAAVIRLLDRTKMRVGNEEYARLNNSFGATTLKNQHVTVRGRSVHFSFRAKGGKHLDLKIDDARLARLIRHCQQLPGQELFTYLDDDGEPRDVGSSDVNEYLREITGEHFTAKDFRTWHGTVSAAEALCDAGRPESPTDAKRRVNEAVRQVAHELANTPAVARACYIDPTVIEAYLADDLPCPSIARSPEPAMVRFLKEHRG
ncbi:MAG: topoisomerase [Gaiellales bacterium]|nr:topoisomerase [Gaiellales bacterium]